MIEIKSGKMEKGLQKVLYKEIVFLFWFNLDCMFAEHHKKSFVPAFFKVTIDHLFVKP